MAVTYGFYDSLNHDRLYNAQQMSAIFDGIINDGVFMSVGNQFHTVAGTGMQVIVKSGRAWFDSTWTLNDAEYPLSIDAADVLLTRIDAVVLEVNSEVATRANTIKVVKGTPASTPAKPTLTNTAAVHQHALAYVTVAKNITAITNGMIEIVVGKTETPYVTAILQTTDITDLFKKWENDFQVWFETVKGTLDGDVALNLQNQIDHCVKKADKATSADIEAGTADKWVDANKLNYINNRILPLGSLLYSCSKNIDDDYLLCNGAPVPYNNNTENLYKNANMIRHIYTEKYTTTRIKLKLPTASSPAIATTFDNQETECTICYRYDDNEYSHIIVYRSSAYSPTSVYYYYKSGINTTNYVYQMTLSTSNIENARDGDLTLLYFSPKIIIGEFYSNNSSAQYHSVFVADLEKNDFNGQFVENNDDYMWTEGELLKYKDDTTYVFGQCRVINGYLNYMRALVIKKNSSGYYKIKYYILNYNSISLQYSNYSSWNIMSYIKSLNQFIFMPRFYNTSYYINFYRVKLPSDFLSEVSSNVVITYPSSSQNLSSTETSNRHYIDSSSYFSPLIYDDGEKGVIETYVSDGYGPILYFINITNNSYTDGIITDVNHIQKTMKFLIDNKEYFISVLTSATGDQFMINLGYVENGKDIIIAKSPVELFAKTNIRPSPYTIEIDKVKIENGYFTFSGISSSSPIVNSFAKFQIVTPMIEENGGVYAYLRIKY